MFSNLLMKISAAIITLNEQRNIGRCLESLKGLVDEIVVIDSGSTDATKEICQNHQVRFIVNEFEGHIQQKNFAIDQCSHHWILALDADEALDDHLRKSIKELNDEKDMDGWSMNRLTNYCGTWVRHSGWYPDKKIRLFQRDRARWGGVNPHDKIIMDHEANVGHLPGDLLHYSFYEREDHLKQIRYFTDISSREMYNAGKSVNPVLHVLKVMAKFLKHYVVRAGFLDGKAGFDIARFSAWATHLKYKKLRNLRRQVH